MNTNIALRLLLAVAASPAAMAQEPTSDTFFTVYNLVRDNFNNGRTLVRLAFHDAMGGVDCEVNLDDSEHNGLANTIAELEAIWTNNQDDLVGLSRADFCAWAYVAGFYLAVPNNAPWVPLMYGRANFAGVHDEDIPPGSSVGSGQHDDVLDYFATHFGFDDRDVATILGAHTLVSLNEEGKARIFSQDP